MRIRLLAVAGLLFACGRTPTYRGGQVVTPDTGCSILVDPEALDFGSVKPGLSYDLVVMVENTGNGVCTLSRIDLADGNDDGFARPPQATTDVSLAGGDQAALVVRFFAPLSKPPFDRKGTLAFGTNDPAHTKVAVPLSAHLAHCALTAMPSTIDFGPVAPFVTRQEAATVTNTGDANCNLTGFTVGGDDGFSLPMAPVTPAQLAVGGQLQLGVQFFGAPTAPLERQGHLDIFEESSNQTAATVKLKATLQACLVSAAPNPYDFGNVALNTTSTHSITLSNNGTIECDLSGFALSPGTDVGFGIPSPPAMLAIAPGGSQPLSLSFAAFDSAPPHLRNGNLTFDSNDPTQPSLNVPLSAFINTICTQAGQYIYTVDASGAFSRFDPSNVTSTFIATLSCPSGSSPFSMNLDQSGVAWVLFADGNIFNVDSTTGVCTPTSYVPGQQGLLTFGMGSSFDAQAGVDTLYIAGGSSGGIQTDPTLASLDLTTLTPTVIGTVLLPPVELAGTGDGQLWAFSPAGVGGNGGAVLARVDKTSAAVLEQYDMSAITSTGGWAVKFWGGAFYVFIGADVWKVPRDSLDPNQSLPKTTPTLIFTNPGGDVVGAGVSTCAPVQGP